MKYGINLPPLRPRLLAGALALVVPARFGTVAAVFHVTPAAAAVTAGVDKEPAAAITRAFADPADVPRRQEIRGRAHDRPKHVVECIGVRRPVPLESSFPLHELGMRHGRSQHGVELL